MRRAAAVVAALVVLAACSAEHDGHGDPLASSSTTPSTAAPTTTTTLPLPIPAPVRWRGCGGGFRCGTLTVPVDYRVAGGPTLDLALIQRPAGDPARRIGTLVMNPGGPGASGVRRVRRGFEISPEVADRFDIVGFDPRGVGDSAPITCGSTVPGFRSLDLAPDTPEEQQALEAGAAAVAAECARTEGDRLAHLGTYEVARYVEELRLALGEPQLSFVGLSYGTLVGLLWAEAFPGSVRSLVLDGAVVRESGTGTNPDQLHAIDRTFDALAAACTADLSCPVTADGGVAAAYDRLAATLEADTGKATAVGPTPLVYAFFRATYGSEQWPRFWRALHDGLRGDLTGISAMADSFTGLVSYAPFTVITCLDTPHPTDPQTWRDDAASAHEVSPRFGAALSNELLPCAFLPFGGLEAHRVLAQGTPPILVVGSTGDVATPYEQAVEVAEQLEHGVLLTVDIDGHVAIGASPCADAAITRYLVDGTTPAPDAHC